MLWIVWLLSALVSYAIVGKVSFWITQDEVLSTVVGLISLFLPVLILNSDPIGDLIQMSDKLWNKATKKSFDWSSLQKEYEKILMSVEPEGLIRKREILKIFIGQQKEEIWNMVENEYRQLLRTRDSEAALGRCHELENMVQDYNREFVTYGPRSWLVTYE